MKRRLGGREKGRNKTVKGEALDEVKLRENSVKLRG
jgi:hypothetical protein